MATPSPGPSDPENTCNGTFSLENVLSNPENLEHPKYREEDKPQGGWDEEGVEQSAAEGFCIECEGVLLFCFRDGVYLLICGVQINQPKCSVKIARTIIAKCVSRHSTGKVLERVMS